MQTVDDTVTTTAPVADDEIVVQHDDGSDEIRVLKGYRKRTATIKLGGDYKGMRVEVWLNSPKGVLRNLSSNDPKVADKALCDFILSHNFVCDDGTPLPTPLTPRDLDVLDNLLQTRIVKAGVEAIQQAAGINPT